MRISLVVNAVVFFVAFLAQNPYGCTNPNATDIPAEAAPATHEVDTETIVVTATPEMTIIATVQQADVPFDGATVCLLWGRGNRWCLETENGSAVFETSFRDDYEVEMVVPANKTAITTTKVDVTENNQTIRFGITDRN